MKQFCKDLQSVAVLNVKLILHNKVLLIVFGIVSLLFILLAGNLAYHAQERSSIPIAVIDNDHSIASKQLMKELKLNDALFVYEIDEKDAKKMLKDQLIVAIYQINLGFEQKILDGDATELIQINYTKENKKVTVISDIVAGHIMYDICLHKSMQLYRSLGEQYTIRSDLEYVKYINQLKKDEMFNFRFDITMANALESSRTNDPKTVNNSLIYQQAILGMISCLLSFFIMFLVNSVAEPYNQVGQRRLRIAQIPSKVIYLGQTLVAMFITFVITSIVTIVLWNILLIKNQYIEVWNIMNVFCLIMILIYVVISVLVTKATYYQFIGSFITLIFGLLGTAQVILGGQQEELLNIKKIIPNYWFIKKFTDIIINSAIV